MMSKNMLYLFLCLAGQAAASLSNDPALVIYYSYDEFGQIVPDQSGKGNNATVVGSVTFEEDGYHHGAARFATGSYLDLSGSEIPPQDIPTTGIGLIAWVKCQNTGGHHAIFNARAGDSTWLVHPELRSEGNFRWLLRSAGANTIFDIRAGSVTWNEWLHFAGVYDQATGRAALYINGVVENERIISNPPQIAGDWDMGARVGYNIDNARPFTGLMDDFCVFTRALTYAEICQAMLGVEDYSQASNPHPTDRSITDVADASVLSWTAGDDAIRHDVYFGTNHDMIEQADSRDVRGVYRGRQTATAYHVPDELALGQRYYWRIDELDEFSQIHRGIVWSFSVANYLVVEGFESYDEFCNQIFFSWLDGVGHTGSAECGQAPFGGNASSSTVELGTMSDVGPRIAHSGMQSMRLTYDNAMWPYYAQTERAFSPAQDWTRYDVNTVTVYLRGNPKNGPDTLYVEIEDATQHRKLVSHPDLQAVVKGYWKRWDIPLSEFAAAGVNLRSIKEMRMGIGDRTALRVGDQGTVHIDDIRLSEGGGTPGLVAHWEFEEGPGGMAPDSAGSNDGTVIGATWGTGQRGQALWFDGRNDYVDCGADEALAPELMTLTFWVFAEESFRYQYLLGKAADLSPNQDYAFSTDGEQKIEFSFGESVFQSVAVKSVDALPVGEWVHIGATRDGATASLYLNGQLENSQAYAFPVTNKGQGLRIGSIGTTDGWSGFSEGGMDEVRIYEQALSPEEMEQIAEGQI